MCVIYEVRNIYLFIYSLLTTAASQQQGYYRFLFLSHGTSGIHGSTAVHQAGPSDYDGKSVVHDTYHETVPARAKKVSIVCHIDACSVR